MVVALYVHGSQQTCKILCHFVPFEVESSRRWNVIVLCGSAVRKLCEDHQWCISEDEGAYFPPCFFWNVKGCSKVPNLLGNDLFKFSGDRCLPLGFEHISKSTFSRNLGLQTKNFATCFSVECLEKLRTSPKTPESWMTCRHEMAWWMGAPEGPRVCWNPLGPFAMDCMLRLNWVPWKNKWTSEALKPWSLQVLTWLYLSTRESTRSVAEASRLCGGANAPSNLTFIYFYDIFVYAKELCLSEFVRSFKIAIGPRMPSFQWGTLPRSGEVFFFVCEACGMRQKASMDGQQQRATSCNRIFLHDFSLKRCKVTFDSIKSSHLLGQSRAALQNVCRTEHGCQQKLSELWLQLHLLRLCWQVWLLPTPTVVGFRASFMRVLAASASLRRCVNVY